MGARICVIGVICGCPCRRNPRIALNPMRSVLASLSVILMWVGLAVSAQSPPPPPRLQRTSRRRPHRWISRATSARSSRPTASSATARRSRADGCASMSRRPRSRAAIPDPPSSPTTASRASWCGACSASTAKTACRLTRIRCPRVRSRCCGPGSIRARCGPTTASTTDARVQDSGHWAYRAPVRPAVPRVSRTGLGAHADRRLHPGAAGEGRPAAVTRGQQDRACCAASRWT